MIQVSLSSDPALERVTRTIVERFNPERVVLFGSRARGDAHEGSDYDLLIVLDTPLERSARDRPVRDAIRPHGLPVDVVVSTPAEYARKRRDVGTLDFAADREGTVLYERPGSTLSVAGAMRVRESPVGPPESLKDWLARAASDFALMDLAHASVQALPDGVCFHAHAAAEKLLKAVLIAAHVPPPRTHELPALLAQVPASLRERVDLIEACALLDALWPNMRYPGQPMPTAADAAAAVEAARTVRQAVLAVLGDGQPRGRG